MEIEKILIFSRQLKPTHIDYTLTVPATVLESVFLIPEGAHMMEFEALDAIGVIWKFRLSTRVTGLYPKPVLLRSSWHPFVVEKGLAPNDRVLFFMEKDEADGFRYTVRAQRKIITLMGQDVWVEIENLHLYGL